ncbi:RimK/LysX family protein [Hoeflea sp. WL0058]|uniref:RimK/LysX family protein n=1 Tax=Flavimaribacter sediminis TaxID=2865987 RepID=A0AAE3D3Y7_9HYPH|nr:RimK/LysX family protein [Flavimaribacter sediminis]MBW8640193.1 RimK/LysX family protein [Flavimaribacter sediminis]
MKAAMNKPVRKSPEIIGWRENVSLPELGLQRLAAKIDTGARTSALHAVNQRIVMRDDVQCVEFTIPVGNRRSTNIVFAPLVGEREIKNSSGVSERRLVVYTSLVMGRHRWRIEVSLTNRERMEYDIIIGRTAIRKRGILVDPGRSFLLDPVQPKSEYGEHGAFPIEIGQLKGRTL